MPPRPIPARFARLVVVLPFLAACGLSGCKSLTAALAGDAAVETAQATPATPRKARKPAGYVDPAISVVPQDADQTAQAEALDNATVADASAGNLGAVVSQPTGIKAGQTSIFSTGTSTVAATDPATIPQGANGSVLAASAYAPAQGVNPSLYSVYGSARRPLPAP